MATYIVIDQGEGGDFAFYYTDTEEQIDEARAALAAWGLDSAPVWAGDPDCPDSYKNGQVVFQQDEASCMLEAWAAALDLDELAGDGGVNALVEGWRQIACADERARVEREQISIATEADWPEGLSREWLREGVDRVIERLYEAAEAEARP